MQVPEGVTSLGAAGAPGVLLLHPWWGITPAMRWWADQLVSVRATGDGRRAPVAAKRGRTGPVAGALMSKDACW